MNNLSTAFRWEDSPDAVFSRNDALTKIIDAQVDRDMDKKKSIETYSTTKLVKLMQEEGNNVVFISRFIKNVVIRWDTSISPFRRKFSWNNDPASLEDKGDTDFCEVLFFDSDGNQSVIEKWEKKILIKELL